MSTIVTPSLLFKTAAVLFGVAVPGHIVFGLQTVHPGITAAESKPAALSKQELRGMVGARNAWDGWNFYGLGLALLNWRYSQTGPPTSTEEKLALAVFAVGNLVHGIRYGLRGETPPFALLAVASSATLGGLALTPGVL